MMELLAPAGGYEALVAAVQNGADAVYLGTGSFNARRSADNFAGDALTEAVAYCHLRGVKVHVTLNTMVREDEYADLEAAIRHIYRSGADALIVQDLGVAEMARCIAPEIALHASTQMAVHNRQGVRYLAEKGFDRAVLAREMEFSEIAECAGQGVELEAFAHGALCVSCSGQCLFSSLVGGRSGNRGMCAQPCRLPYSLDGKEGYLLSTRDLMTLELLGEFRKAGVSSLKIEGRLKRPEYVAIVTRIYRRVLDGDSPTEQDIHELRQIFNRGGFTRGYGPGVEEKTFMYPVRPNHAGVEIGSCEKRGLIRLSADTLSADALVLRGKGEDRPVNLEGMSGAKVVCPQALTGDTLVRLTSEEQMKRARESFASEHRASPAEAELTLKIGEPARLRMKSGVLEAESVGAAAEVARSGKIDAERVLSQIKKTGGTAFTVEHVSLAGDENAFLPVSELNRMRRDALDELTRIKCAVNRREGEAPDHSLSREVNRLRSLRAQSGSVKALRIALENGADAAIFAPEDLRRLDDALALEPFYLALPQVLRAEELDALHAWALAHRDRIAGTYLSNVAHLSMDWPGEIIADYPLNIASNATIRRIGADLYTPSAELTARQVGNLGGRRELVVYGRLMLMQLRHCPNRAAKGLPGKHKDCRLCDQTGARPLPPLIDRTGAAFPLRRIACETGCIVQVLNSVPLMLLRRLEKLPAAENWRILVEENDAKPVARLYRAAADGRDFRALPEWARMDAEKTTTGHFFRGVE